MTLPQSSLTWQVICEPSSPSVTPESVSVELSLPTACEWNLAIYNVSGRKVAEFSGYSHAGIVKVDWDAGDNASGVYFYKVEAGSFSATKKMMLLK